jgi:hypothetical protein
MAERAGFEPAIPFWSIHTFQACALNHSATSPTSKVRIQRQSCIRDAIVLASNNSVKIEKRTELSKKLIN